VLHRKQTDVVRPNTLHARKSRAIKAITNQQNDKMDTNRLLMLAGAGAGGYYLMGKKPIGVLVGIAVLMLLTRTGQQPLTTVVPTPEPSLGAPEASGLPAPGTTADPSGGYIDPNNSTKRIGLLR